MPEVEAQSQWDALWVKERTDQLSLVNRENAPWNLHDIHDTEDKQSMAKWASKEGKPNSNAIENVQKNLSRNSPVLVKDMSVQLQKTFRTTNSKGSEKNLPSVLRSTAVLPTHKIAVLDSILTRSPEEASGYQEPWTLSSQSLCRSKTTLCCHVNVFAFPSFYSLLCCPPLQTTQPRLSGLQQTFLSTMEQSSLQCLA